MAVQHRGKGAGTLLNFWSKLAERGRRERKRRKGRE